MNREILRKKVVLGVRIASSACIGNKEPVLQGEAFQYTMRTTLPRGPCGAKTKQLNSLLRLLSSYARVSKGESQLPNSNEATTQRQ